MNTLEQYLENIAKSILVPLGRYYRAGSMPGYGGIHQDADGSIREKWVIMGTVSIPVGYMVVEGTTEPAEAVYNLYWTEDHDDMGSWWVKW